jgi:hypothetical protein
LPVTGRRAAPGILDICLSIPTGLDDRIPLCNFRPYSPIPLGRIMLGDRGAQNEIDRIVELAGDLLVADEACRHQGTGKRHL